MPKKAKGGFAACCAGPKQARRDEEDAEAQRRLREGERRKAARREKENTKRKMAVAAEHMDNGTYEEAEQLYQEIAEEDPSRRGVQSTESSVLGGLSPR